MEYYFTFLGIQLLYFQLIGSNLYKFFLHFDIFSYFQLQDTRRNYENQRNNPNRRLLYNTKEQVHCRDFDIDYALHLAANYVIHFHSILHILFLVESCYDFHYNLPHSMAHL